MSKEQILLYGRFSKSRGDQIHGLERERVSNPTASETASPEENIRTRGTGLNRGECAQTT